MKLRSRTRARLILRDVAAAAAFGSMAASGELPLWGVGLFGIALVLALFGRRPLSGHGTISAIALLLGAVGLYLNVAAGAIDLVVAASTFAGLITAQRLLAEPNAGTDNQVHLTSLLMISGGAALSGDLLFGLALTLFAVCISLSLGLGVVDGAAGDQEELTVRPALRQIGVGAAFAILGGLIFFIAFPRLSWNVAARHMPKGIAPSTGLSTTIQLGTTGGTIKTSARVVARVKLTPDPGKAELNDYFVASHLSRFDGRSWDGPKEQGTARGSVMMASGDQARVSQDYELLPGYGPPIAVALSPPTGFFNAVALKESASTRSGFVVVAGREVRISTVANGYSYTAWSRPNGSPTPATDEERVDALTLPEKLDPRVKALAEQVVGNEKDPARAAQKLEDYLKRNYRYTLELPGQVDDPLANFLFERKAGHCEFYATALAIMLRTLGIPARVAVGFFGGKRNGDHYVLRSGDAHAWTQVYIAKKGFVTYDATPEEFRGAQPSSLASLLTDLYESIESWWARRVVDYSFRDQMEFAQKLVSPPSGHRGQLQLAARLPKRIFATGLAGLLAFILVRVALRRSRRNPHEATALFELLQKTAARAGLPPKENEDVSELVRRLKLAAPPLAPAVQKASARYLEARFGQKPLQPGELRHYERTLARSAAVSSKAR